MGSQHLKAQWTASYVSTNRDLNCIFAVDNNNAHIVDGDSCNYGYTYKTSNAGTLWQSNMQTFCGLSSLYFTHPDTGYAVGELGLYFKTVDGGVNWNAGTTPSNKNLNDIFFINNTIGFIAGDSGTILKTTDAGATWIPKTSSTSGDLFSVSFVDTNVGFASNKYSGIVMRTIDGGNSWTTHYISLFDLFNDITFISADTGFSCGQYGKIYKTTDSAGSWAPQNVYGVAFGTNLNSLYFVNHNTGYTVGDSGVVVKTIDGGKNWYAQNSGTKHNLHSVSFVNASLGYAVGDSGIVIKTVNGGLNGTRELKKRAELTTYPNPFTSSLTIEMADVVNDDAVLELYNLLGDKMISHEITKDTNRFILKRGDLASGVYFFQLKNSEGILASGRLTAE